MLDLRLPIGALFVIIGTMLVVYGLICPVSTPVNGYDVNLNMAWGALMGVFGLCMALLVYKNHVTG